jgi:hypothetical protein
MMFFFDRSFPARSFNRMQVIQVGVGWLALSLMDAMPTAKQYSQCLQLTSLRIYRFKSDSGEEVTGGLMEQRKYCTLHGFCTTDY